MMAAVPGSPVRSWNASRRGAAPPSDGQVNALREARRMLAAPMAARAEWVREIAAATSANDHAGLRALRFGWPSAVQDVVIDRGVGVVQIAGALVQGTIIQDYSAVRLVLDELAANPAVHAILLEIDSPGGDVHAALFELAARIREVRATKPVYALADGQATSAAYLIASQASRVFAANARTTLVGSLGVIAVHVDWSGFNAQQGLAIEEITTGDHKAELSPDRPLSREGRATLERIVEGAFVELIASVTAGRGVLTDESIRAQQAAIYLGGEGIAAGLVDGVMARGALIDELVRAKAPRQAPAASGHRAAASKPAGLSAAERARFRAELDVAAKAGRLGISAAKTLELARRLATDAELEQAAQTDNVMARAVDALLAQRGNSRPEECV